MPNKKYRDKIILFLSSYFPMYIIIIIQNLSLLYNKLIDSRNKKIGSIILYPEFYVAIVCFILLFLLYYCVYKMLQGIKEYSCNNIIVKVIKIENVNYQYILTYFSVYIFPFITLNLCSISGILQFIVLFILIGYIYIKNNIVYINPLLNIVFHYNIHNVTMRYIDDSEVIDIETILFTKKESICLKNKTINVMKQAEEFYIEV